MACCYWLSFDLFAGEFGLVFGVDAKGLDGTQFLLLDRLYL